MITFRAARVSLMTAFAAPTFAILATFAGPSEARADTPPSAWELAKDPAARDLWELHARVSQLLFSPRDLTGDMRDILTDQARALLEAAHAETSPDVRLRFDLGRAYERLNHHRQAIEVLQAAVDAFPDHPGASDALIDLAYAYAKTDQPTGEREAYKRYLARATTDGARATALLNLAEAEMRIGNLPDAVSGYREAIDASTRVSALGGSITAVLGYWGLAVALDRSGDPASASRETRMANQLDPGQRQIGDGSRNSVVFFEPAHERFWYTALGAQEEARTATDARAALRAWKSAYERWSAYVSAADRVDPQDRFLPLARAHLAAAQKDLSAAQKRVASMPKAPPTMVIIDD